MVNDFEEEVRALEEYGHDCCARIDDRIHECCKRIREAHEQELDNTRYAYEVSLALMKKQPSPLGDLCGIWKERDGGVDAGGRVETGGGRSDAAADGHMADSAGSQVSEGVAPITAELRETIRSLAIDDSVLTIGGDDFHRLCDAIDAVHAQLERENAELRERVAKLDESADSMHDGWVRLPVDADGVPIHVGDVMDGTCPSGRHVNGTVSAIGDGVFWLSNVQFSLKPNYMHHYHAPTVEDVLREFAYGLGVPVADSYVAAAASKLRLAGDAETCRQEERGWTTEGDHARVFLTCGHDCMVETVADLPNFCPVCGARVEAAK